MAPHTGKFVAYYRVSTDKQGASGLGLDAQRELVTNFLNGGRWSVIGEFTEIESGRKRLRDRPMLQAALQLARKQKARVIVARLDRLARDELMIQTIIESKVAVTFCEMPDLDTSTADGRLRLSMMSSIAAYEARRIGERTKAALKQLKKQGVKLGSPTPEVGSAEGVKVIMAKADAYANRVGPIVRDIIRKSGASTMRDIAAALTARGVETPRGNTDWHPSQVSNLLKRIK